MRQLAIVLAVVSVTSLCWAAEPDAKVEANIQKPIVYGYGAAGITLATSFEESKTLLSSPKIGPLRDRDGATLYEEGIYVLWNFNEGQPALPFLIVINKDYKGKMQAGKFGDIGIGTQFTSFKGSDSGLQELTKSLYNELENEKGDCLKAQKCKLIVGDNSMSNAVVILPGAIILVSKTELQVVEVRIANTQAN